jgi:hypothetical protein
MARAAKTELRTAGERRAPRERAFLRARVSYASGAVSFPCLVVQISRTGGKLAVADDVTVPDRFQIEIPQRGIDCPAEMVWRRKGQVGVAFLKTKAREPEGWEASLKRLRELEAENAKLRANLLALTEQVNRITDSY